MPGPHPSFDPDDAIKRYLAGETAGAIAEDYGIPRRRIVAYLGRRGLTRRPPPFDETEAVERYLSGDGTTAIANDLGVTRWRVTEAVRKAGHTVMTRSDSQAVRNRREAGSEAFIDRMERMHVAARGRRRTVDEYLRITSTRERRQSQVGAGEREVAEWLAARGIAVETQKAVPPYNLDLSFGCVDVEVHRYKRSPLNGPSLKRIKDLTDGGWHVVYVWESSAHPLIEAIADDLVALLHELNGLPARPGQYWVVRGCGEVASCGCEDLDDQTVIRPARSGHARSRWHPHSCSTG